MSTVDMSERNGLHVHFENVQWPKYVEHNEIRAVPLVAYTSKLAKTTPHKMCNKISTINHGMLYCHRAGTGNAFRLVFSS